VKYSIVALLLSFWLSGCVETTIARANLKPKGAPAQPAMQIGLPNYAELMQANVYGVLPTRSQTKVLSKTVLNPVALNGKARLEEWNIAISAGFGDDESSNSSEFNLVVVLPNGATGPVPVIMMQTFCPSHVVIPLAGVSVLPGGFRGCDGDGFTSKAVRYVFGRYIASPPIEEILANGFAIATQYPGQAFPDGASAGLAALRKMSTGHEDDDTRWGAIAAWGWMFSRAVDALEADGRFDPNAMIAYGHSRYGKSALVAAAFDQRIDGVISHQSGTGGASLSRGNLGETVAKITTSYPHWFSRKFASYAERTGDLPVDQHYLLALMAPRPVLLGNARRDVWSDPNGAFRAAQAASPAWVELGQIGLGQDRLVPFVPNANLSFWIRPGTHGVTEEDWPAFLEFLNAHFPED